MARYSDQLFLSKIMGVHVFPTVFLVISQLIHLTQAREFCQADGYWCDTGHCCGSDECCTYYYELWWFWLVWFLIVFIIGFCVWQRKRFHPWRDNRCERTCSIQDMFFGRGGFNISDITPVPPCKLPSYSEIGETVSYDTPPPPYNVESALPACLGEGPSTSLPAGERHYPPPHRSLQAITQHSSSLNSTPSPSDAPPSYSMIISSGSPVFAAMPSTPILPHHRSTTATQCPEQGPEQGPVASSQQENENNSGCSTASNTPTTPVRPPPSPARPTSSSVTQVTSMVATCACGSPLRSPVIAPHHPHARMLPPSVPPSPKTTVVSMKQRPQRFLSPSASPHRFTTSVVGSSQSSSCSNLSAQNSPRAGQSSSNAGTPPRPGSAVRTASPVSTSPQGDNRSSSSSGGHTVVDMRTSRRGFMSRWHFR